jgi:aldehyde dehydrogenase (NAD+)
VERARQFYIAGRWVVPQSSETVDVVNPATEEPIATIAMGNAADVDAAVSAARAAFEGFSQSTREDRLALFDRIVEVGSARLDELGDVISAEMGAPVAMARKMQARTLVGQFKSMRDVLAEYPFEVDLGGAMVVREPIGVCGLITPWNWPINQISAKVAPALAAGCTMVLKPSEVSPLNALLFTEILHDAGVPAGVFNLVNGGAVAGQALVAHPDVDMVSFTGSTRAGVEVARAAAPTVKRVAQELGGKSANILLDDADFEAVISRDMARLYRNSGQTCNAPTRMLVPRARMDEVAEIAARAAKQFVVGDPRSDSSEMGPLVSAAQFDRVQSYIERGIAEGATVVAGGPGKPEGLATGYFVRPTVFADVTNDMSIAREEIFGPVLVLIGYDDEDDAVRIANDSEYGLSGYVSGSPDRARILARRMRTGMVHVNGAPPDNRAPFGGYGASGNGREGGRYGLEEFLETKSIYGYSA